MEQEKTLSVIVPVYRVEDYLRRCVDSILAQDVPGMEVILVDDGSPDGSGSICDAYARQDPRVQVIHKENGGLSSARNAGLDRATGEFVSFVDSDDYLEPGAYSAMLALAKAQEAQLVCGGRYDEDADTGAVQVGLCPETTEAVSPETMVGRIFLWDGCDSSACDKIFCRTLFAGIRFPQGRVCEDVPVIYRVVLNAGKVVFWDRPFYHYVHRGGSISQSGVSAQTLHFSQHTGQILEDIRRSHPALLPQARYLRVRSLSHLMLVLGQADPQTRRAYAADYRQAHRDLARQTGFVLTSPYLQGRERLRDLLLVLGLYRLLRPLLHRGGENA